MSDEVLNIRVTEAELDLITCLLEQAGSMEDSTGQPAFELLHDLMEQAARPGEWNDPEDPDLLMDQIVICDAEINAETQMFNAGVKAREQAKASSRAAERRALNFSTREAGDRSETQKHDLRSKPSNDPADW